MRLHLRFKIPTPGTSIEITPPAGSAAANGYAAQMAFRLIIVNIHKVMSQGMDIKKGSYAGDCPLDKTQDEYNEKQDYR